MLFQYYLMHKNIIAGVLTVNTDTASVVDCKVIESENAPIGHHNKKALTNWLNRRALPIHQHNQDILKDGKDNFSYMMDNLGLSLIDCYWFKPIDSDYTWESVNLFAHDFAEKDFNYSDTDNVSPFKPSATTQGELQKRWVIKDGERYLVKGNYGNMYRQSINEVLATLLHQKQGFEHTHYDLIELPTTLGSGLGCISRDFASESLEFIPAYDVTFFDKQKNEESIAMQYIRVCSENGIDKEYMQRWYDYQILSDFLLTNTDRHLLNLGVLRNPDTLEFVKPAPIFDSGNSMFYLNNYSVKTVFEIPTTSFYKTELKMMDTVKDRSVLDLDKIPTETEIRQLYSNDPYSIVYLDNMLLGYQKKIEMISAFQKGYSLNPKSVNFYIDKEASAEELDDFECADCENER